MRTAFLGCMALGAALACGPAALPPAGHLVVHLDTDAPVPRAGVPEGPAWGMAILDTVRIEVLEPDGAPACTSCRRELALESERLEADATFTIARAVAGRGLLHAVAFRADRAKAAGPGAVVEVWAALPDVPAEGPRDVTLALPLAAIGRPIGSREAPVALIEGAPARPRALAPMARRTACMAPGPEGTVCIPGSVFWMGTPELPLYSNLAPRVVALAPFWIDAHEVTVGALRAGGQAAGVVPSSGSQSGTASEDFCTFTRAPGPYEGYPVNCVPFETARAHCLARGGDLPTEAQLELTSSGLAGWTYVWGRDAPACTDGVLARGPRYELFAEGTPPWPRSCLPEPGGDPVLERLGFPRPVARPTLTRERDALVLPGGEVRDLGGSMSEWTRDVWQESDAPYFTDPALRIDPISTSGDLTARAVRGGNLTSNGVPSWWRESFPIHGGDHGIELGFRCVYPASAPP